VGYPLNVVFLDLLPIGCALDNSGEIANWQLEGEVKSRKHDCHEYPPTQATSDERECATGNLQVCRRRKVACSSLEIGPRKAGEGTNKSEEDHEEDRVGAECQDHV